MKKLETYNVCKVKTSNPRVHVDVCKWHVKEEDPDCCKDTKFGYECNVAELIRQEGGENGIEVSELKEISEDELI